MNVKKWSLLRMVPPCVGLVLTCIGVYLMSLQTEHMVEAPAWRLVSAYITLVLGLLSMVCGLFWTVFHSMKTKLYQRRSSRERQHMQIYTIKRLTSFPPSYEESQQSQVCADASAGFVTDAATGLAPPLYSQDASEAPDCTWSCEQPPRYSRMEGIQQGQVDAGEQSQTRRE